MIKLKIVIPVLLFLFQSASFAQDVPFVPTSPEVVNGMLTLAEVTEKDVVYDLGCGDGRIVVAAAKDFGANGIGVDSNPQRIAESNENAKRNNVEDKVKFLEQNLFEADIDDATVVAIYLLNSVNLKLRPKLLNELKPGSRVVSHAFDMNEWEPDAHQIIDERDIYLWIIPENASGTWDSKNDYSLAIDQQFQKISGFMNSGGKKLNISKGKIDGTRITFTLEGSGTFEGIIKGDKITGTMINGKEEELIFERQNGTKKPLENTVMMDRN